MGIAVTGEVDLVLFEVQNLDEVRIQSSRPTEGCRVSL